jgi:hypothetical protein
MLSPTYKYYSSILEQSGTLPYGIYELCLKVYLLTASEEKGSACIIQEVTPISPPLLLSPNNASTISTAFPLLVWLPPTPIYNSEKILYDLKLVELTQNQTFYDAIQRNYALIEQKDLSVTHFQYPANALPLEVGKTYAWKIIAKSSNGVFIGETEIWTFKLIKDEPEDEVIVNENYIIPKTTLDGSITYIGKLLKVQLENIVVETNKQNYKIYDAQNKEIATDKMRLENEGNGKLVFYLEDVTQLKNKKFYYLQLTSKADEKQYLYEENIHHHIYCRHSIRHCISFVRIIFYASNSIYKYR